MALVFGWPDVGAVGSEWTVDNPISKSYSGVTGRRYASAYKPERRMARLSVSAIGLDMAGAGYCEALKKLLEGGEHFVRLYSYPINWHLGLSHSLKGLREGTAVEWETPPDPVEWETPPDEVVWFTGAQYSFVAGATVNGMPTITVSGLPPNTVIIHPGEFVLFDGITSIMAVAPATSNASGVATIKLISAAPTAEGVELGSRDTGVFEIVGDLPRAMQPVNSDWAYDWSFAEVFEDEVIDGFEEVPSWWRAT